MTVTKRSLREYIRFQLEQMSVRNEAHQFEKLSFDLAKLRVASNVIPATGPVESGGDQGRDFEGFRSYISHSNIANDTFLARNSGDLIVFACTLNKKIEAKIKADLATIFGSDIKPAEVCVFCVPDVTVNKRHKLQTFCLDEHGARLQVFDGQAIAEMLSDGDTFWIAEEYLSIPSNMFPEVTGDAEYQRLKEKWLEGTQSIENHADFLDVKRGLRRATREPALRPDLTKWMARMREIGRKQEQRRKSQYELAVAALRGHGSMDPEVKGVVEYFNTVPDDPSLPEIEDLTNLASYASTASGTGGLSIERETVKKWSETAERLLDLQLDLEKPQHERYQLLILKGQSQLQKLLSTPESADVCLGYWDQAMEMAERNPLCDVSQISDLLNIAAPFLGDSPNFNPFVDRVDKVSGTREGAAAAADSARSRAVAFARNGQFVRAIDQLHRAKIGWFAAETMRGSLLATVTLSEWYERLELPLAARFHCMAAIYVGLRIDDDVGKRIAVRAGFQLADTFYRAGEVLAFLRTVGLMFGSHFAVMPDPDDFDQHEYALRACRYACAIMALSNRLAPELLSAAQEIVRNWPLDEETKTAIVDSANLPAWEALALSQVEARLAEQIGQAITNGLGDHFESRWTALGIDWKISAPLELTAFAEQLGAIIQVFIVDLANIDLLLLPSAAEIRLEMSVAADFDLVQEPDNGSLIWTLHVPEARRLTSERGDGDMHEINIHLLAVVISIFTQLSLLPRSDFMPLLESRMQGLMSRAFWVRPPAELMNGAREIAAADVSVPDPIVLAVRRDIQPLCAEELRWRSSTSHLYKPETAAELISNRYRRMTPFARQAVPLAMADPIMRRRLIKLHQDGMLDWQILSILLNICLTQRTERRIGRTYSDATDQLMATQLEELKKLEAGVDPDLDLSIVEDDLWQFQSHSQLVAVLKAWGLETRRTTPNFGAIKRLLDQRFNHSKDDVEHEDFFKWPRQGEIGLAQDFEDKS